MNKQHTQQSIMPSGHTPGPWVSYPSPKGHAFDIHDGRDGTPFELIAHVPLTEKTELGIRFTDERMANARLIAAAPELLEALELAAKLVSTARRHFPKSIKHSDRFELELVSAQINKVMNKATSQP